jgi:hypothetical protein
VFNPFFQLGSHALSPYALLLIATAAAAALLGLRVIVREQGSRIGWWFFTLAGLTSWWLFGRAMSSSAPDSSSAAIWVHLSYIAEPLLPATMLQFAHIATGRERDARRIELAIWFLALTGITPGATFPDTGRAHSSSWCLRC